MKKTPQHKKILKEYVRHPAFWGVVHENGYYLHIRNRFTGERRVCRKK